MNRPEWATAKIKFYLAKAWAADLDTECPTVKGINWFHDIIFLFCAWYHNIFVQPFSDLEGFPFQVLELYEPLDNHE